MKHEINIMKKIHPCLIIIAIAFSGFSCKRQSQVIMLFANSLEAERTGEVITVENKFLTNFTGEFSESDKLLFLPP